jgi:hypothetical protein
LSWVEGKIPSNDEGREGWGLIVNDVGILEENFELKLSTLM